MPFQIEGGGSVRPVAGSNAGSKGEEEGWLLLLLLLWTSTTPDDDDEDEDSSTVAASAARIAAVRALVTRSRRRSFLGRPRRGASSPSIGGADLVEASCSFGGGAGFSSPSLPLRCRQAC